MKHWAKRENRVLGNILEEKAIANRDKIFLKFRDQEFTHESINTNANRIANGLIDIGVKKGDKVGIMLGNCENGRY
jgi:non-ribosomal peptide synthetase component E (peptide arylation enzyme)